MEKMNVYFLVDRSGSMKTRWLETVNAINGYVEDLKKNPDTAFANITIYAFDSISSIRFERVRCTSVSRYVPISENEIAPSGMTPLYDAIGRLNSVIMDSGPMEKATIIIVTDGHENTSREMRKEGAKSIIDSYKAKGYDVVFMGADFDAMGQSTSLGGTYENTLNMGSGKYRSAMASMAGKTMRYAETGTVRGFTDAERNDAK